MPSGVNAREQSSLRFVNVALNWRILSEQRSALGSRELSDVPDHIFFNREASDGEFCLRVLLVLDVAFIVGLATALGMEDRPIQDHDEMGLRSLCLDIGRRKHVKNETVAFKL